MTTTTVTTTTRRRRRSAATGGHEARRGSTTPGVLDYDTTVASHRHFYSPFSGSPRFSRPTFSLDSGWVEGLDGRFAGQDTIEEVEDDYDDDERDDNNNETNEDDEYYDRGYERGNNGKNTRLLSLFPTDVRRNTFGIPIISEVEPLPHPPPPPPPPCPPSDQNRRSSPPLFPKHKPRDASLRSETPPTIMPVANALPPEPPQPQPKLDSVTEIALLQDNFTLLRTVLEDLRIMCTWFYAQSPVEAYTDHIDICGTIEDSVQVVLESLTRRRKLGEEEWSVRSPGWHQKYTKRMYSLNRTLIRLLSIRASIQKRLLKPHQIAMVLKKLQEHQNKMADLAKKFQAGFDRLRLRHIHYLLNKAHTDAHQRDEARRLDEASFERQWYEDKAIRADLRREFFAHRNRQSSAQ